MASPHILDAALPPEAEEAAMVEQGAQEAAQPDREQPAAAQPEATEKAPDGQETAPEKPPAPKPPQMVPVQHMIEERRRAAAEKARADNYEKQFQRVLQRMAPDGEQPAPKPQLPDLNADPVANLDTRTMTAEQKIAAFEQRENERAQQAEVARQEQAVIATYKAQANEFAKAEPAFADAYRYLTQHRIAELQMMGYDEAQAQHIAEQNEFAVALSALQRGQNPAEIFFKAAQHRGWAPKAAQQQANGAARVQTMQAAAKAATSVGGGGGAATAPLTLESVSRMTDEEMDAMTPAQWRKVNGG